MGKNGADKDFLVCIVNQYDEAIFVPPTLKTVKLPTKSADGKTS